jgi:hypothetical protein
MLRIINEFIIYRCVLFLADNKITEWLHLILDDSFRNEQVLPGDIFIRRDSLSEEITVTIEHSGSKIWVFTTGRSKAFPKVHEIQRFNKGRWLLEVYYRYNLIREDRFGRIK